MILYSVDTCFLEHDGFPHNKISECPCDAVMPHRHTILLFQCHFLLFKVEVEPYALSDLFN